MEIKTSDPTNQTPTFVQKPYQTPKLEVHQAYSSLTAGIGFSFGEFVPTSPSILDDSVSLDPQEFGI